MKENLITPDQLQQALLRQKQSGGKLGSVLVELGFLQEEETRGCVMTDADTTGVRRPA